MVRQAHHPERPVVKANFHNRRSKGNPVLSGLLDPGFRRGDGVGDPIPLKLMTLGLDPNHANLEDPIFYSPSPECHAREGGEVSLFINPK